MDCSLPGSSIHGIFQARVLEWGAIAFSTVPLEYSWILLLQKGPLEGRPSDFVSDLQDVMCEGVLNVTGPKCAIFSS